MYIIILCFQYSSSINNYILSVRSNISYVNLRENERLLRENILLQSGKESFITRPTCFYGGRQLISSEFDYITAAVINYTINYQNNYITPDKAASKQEEGMEFSPMHVGIVSNTSKTTV